MKLYHQCLGISFFYAGNILFPYYSFKSCSNQVDWTNHSQVPFPCEVSMEKTLIEMFREATFDDLWCECSDIRDVLVYARGSKRLRIPEGWREVLPTEL